MHNVKNCLDSAWYVKLGLTWHVIVKQSFKAWPHALLFFLLRSNRLKRLFVCLVVFRAFSSTCERLAAWFVSDHCLIAD